MAKKCVASEGLNIEQYSKEALGAVKTNSTADRQEQLSDAPFLQLVTQLSSSHLDEVKDRAMALLCNASDRQFGLLIRRGKVQTLVKVLQQSLRKGRTSRVTEDAALLLAKCKQAGRQEEKPTPAPQARAAAPQGQAQGQTDKTLAHKAELARLVADAKLQKKINNTLSKRASQVAELQKMDEEQQAALQELSLHLETMKRENKLYERANRQLLQKLESAEAALSKEKGMKAAAISKAREWPKSAGLRLSVTMKSEEHEVFSLHRRLGKLQRQTEAQDHQ